MSQGKSTAGKGSARVEAFLDQLDHPHKPAIVALRQLILSLDPRIGEDIKWNGPSFLLDDHFATFKLHPPTAVQLVLHRGARPAPQQKRFDIPDPEGLLKWAASDRCVLTLRDFDELDSRQAAIATILSAWIGQL
ncbi:DUF1801 domain-containing protein [Massilia horti]|uniref:DUF1801 domain-containing protein n=1 Tax=Massilia horti TaxID=2562153 RepID=A0A4Y9T2T1_9BURK|nr:DUF1801 domain-containing protein [Massilia horti]TFW33789.1 DUF1801 domain-containing protein [Massilia horti]